MAPKKKDAKGEQQESIEDALRRFPKKYKELCDVACCIPLESIAKGIPVDEVSGPPKIDWLLVNRERLSAINLEALVGACITLFPNVLAVRHLTLWGVGLGDTAVEKILPMLTKPAPQPYGTPQLPQQQVEHLDLLEEGITPFGCSLLAEALTGNVFLKKLHLNYNEIGDTGIEALLAGLKLNTFLEALHLEYCGLGTTGAISLASLLKDHKECGLIDLNLKGNHLIGMTAVRTLLAGVQGSATLQKLNLHDTFKQRDENPDEFRETLRDTLVGHPSLSELDLSGNALGAEDGTILLGALQMNRGICVLPVDRDLGELYTEINTLVAENLVLKLKAAKGGKKKKK